MLSRGSVGLRSSRYNSLAECVTERVAQQYVSIMPAIGEDHYARGFIRSANDAGKRSGHGIGDSLI
jgi:hypothetical protein